MPVVDNNDHAAKPRDNNGDKAGDQTQNNSHKTDERMRSEVGDSSNKSWWQAVADKHQANLPALAIDGPLDSTVANATGYDVSAIPTSTTASDASTLPANAKGPADLTAPATAVPSDAPAQPAPPKLDPETVQKYAQELHKAINRDDNGVLGIGGGDDPDNKKITDLLDSLTAADRKAIEDAYANTDDNKKHKSLRDELQSNLDGDDWRKAEAILNRRDGRTNDAGNLMVALSAINDDRGDAERRVLETFSTLNKDQQKLLEDEFKKDYGMTVDEALNKYDVSGDAMKAVGFLRKPIEERTAKDIEDFAHFAIDKKNLDYFGIALRGDTPAAKEARETLSKDEDFKKQINDAFKPHRDGGILGGIKNVVSVIPGGDLLVGGFNLVEGLVKGDLDFDRLTEGTTIDKLRSAVSSKEIDSKQLQAMDILHSGHVSLATIAADNTGSIFGWFDNEKAIGNAADNATDGERQLFSRGYEIAKNGGNATTDEEKNALNFYNDIHKAFDDASGGKDAAKWEDKLLNGKGGSIISAVADGDGKNGRFAAVEGLSKEDWEKLKDPKSGPQFRKEVEEYLGKFTDDDETPRLLELIDKKVAAETFEDSQKINRSLFDVIQQNKGHDFLVFGTDYDGKNVTAAIAGLSADESAKYKNDSGFRSEVDKFVDDNLDGTEKAYAKRILSQVAETGEQPKHDAVTTLLSDKVNGVEAKDAIGDVEAALKDDKLRQRLADNKDLTDEEKSIKSVIDGYVQQALIGKFGLAAGDGAVQANQKEYISTLYETGRLSVEQKAELGLRTKDFFIDAATASPEERQKLYDSKLVNDDDKKLIDTLVKQGGKMDLADEIRSFVLKDGTEVESFGDKLKALTPEQKQELRDEYTKKFGSTIDDDLLSKVSEADRNNFRTYLTATNVDGRQDFYDNLERALKSESGFSPDGSQEVLDRSLTDQAAMLGDFQSKFEQLPADKQELANKYFSEALKDYQTSKEQFAEKLYQVAVIVGGIAVGVATGGVGLAALATVAAVGAVGRIALKKVIQGEDYDLSLSNVLKDGAIGAITAGVSVIGPETFAAFARVGTVAAERFAVTAGEQLIEQGLKQGGKEIIEKEATNLIAHAVVRGEPISEQAISQIIDKAAVSGISQSERTALEAALKTSIQDGGRTVSEQAIKSTLAGTVRQAGVFGTIGGTANVLIEGSVGLANGHLDISSLPAAFATGFAFGSTLSVGFEAVSRGAAHFKSGGPEVPAGATEHLELNFTKAEDGSIKITAPEGKDIDLTVKVDGKEQTIHVDSQGTKLPDGAEGIGIKNAEIKSPEVKALDDTGTVLAPKQDTPVPAAPVPVDVSAGSVIPEQGGLINKFKRWLNGSAAETQAQPLQFTKLADTRVTVDGQAVPVNNGTVKIGRDTIADITDTRVSRNQGLLRWNEADKSYYFTDTSSNGTYIRNGDSYAKLPQGKEVKLNPDQEIRLGSINGPKLEFFNLNQASPIPLVDRQVYINGEATNFQNGALELGRSHQTLGGDDLVTNMVSKNHGTIKVDPVTGEYRYTDHSNNGTYIKHADGTYQRVKGEEVSIKPNDEIHLGFKDGPTVKVQDTMGRQLSDGSVLYRRAEGDWIAKNDGTRVLDDRAGSRVTFDANNKVINADSAYGVGTKFDYAENGQLQSVRFANGSKYSTADGVNWKIENVGQPETTYVGKISVESNGALRFEDPSTGRSTIRNIDGSEEIRVPGRQVEYTKANYQIENQKLDALVKYNFPDEAQASRFTGLMREFESRGLPPTEVAETYRQVSRLLSTGDGSTLGVVERTRLSEQILFEAAHPEWIDQGFNNTCNVTTLETRAFERDPASAARLITDVALTGKYVTPEGVTVDVGRTGGLTPDAESMLSLQQPFRRNNGYADVSMDGRRTYAGQIFENTAVNIHYADLMSGSVTNRGSYVWEPGDVIQYKKVAPAPGQTGDTGERLVAYRTDANGTLQEIQISNDPHIYTHELGDIYNRIVPSTDATGAPITGTETGFLVQGPNLRSDSRVLSAQTPNDLQNILLDAKNQGKFPVVLYVDSRDPIFWKTATSNPGGAGGAHVVTVENVHWEPGPNGTQVLKADYYNQWGIVSNKVGADAVDINDLYRATVLRDTDGNFPTWALPYVKNPPPPPPPKPVLTPEQLAKLPPPPNPFPLPSPFPPPNPFPSPIPSPLPPPNPSPFAPAPSR